MSESELSVIKPEALKSFVWLECADGSIQQVEEEVAMFCPVICREILQSGMGSSKNYAISLPERVYPSSLSLILDYCRFHSVPGRSNKERKSFDERYIKLDTKRLCELASAAHSLQLNPLVDLTSRALARMIEGKTPEEIRETFHLPDDLTEEEKLEPLKNTTDDPRIRLLNRLYAKKRKELKEKQKLKILEFLKRGRRGHIPRATRLQTSSILADVNVAIEEVEEERVDDRSVDDLLSFINGDGDSKAAKAAKNKKSRRKKDQSKDPPKSTSNKTHKKELASLSPSPSYNLEVKKSAEDSFSSKIEFDDADNDDGLDPAMKEELDREIEDFARRLNSDWPERMQEILSLGQESRFVPNLLNGNGPVWRCTGLDGR